MTLPVLVPPRPSLEAVYLAAAASLLTALMITLLLVLPEAEIKPALVPLAVVITALSKKLELARLVLE